MRTAVREAAPYDVVAAVGALVQSLHTKRDRLARRLDDMERELHTLAGKVDASEPRLRDVRWHAGGR